MGETGLMGLFEFQWKHWGPLSETPPKNTQQWIFSHTLFTWMKAKEEGASTRLICLFSLLNSIKRQDELTNE